MILICVQCASLALWTINSLDAVLWILWAPALRPNGFQDSSSGTVPHVSPTDYLMSAHVTKSPRPSPSIFAYCKQSNTGGVWPQNEVISKVCIPLAHVLSHPQPAIAVLPSNSSQNHCNLYTGATVVYADVKCRDVINLQASDLLKVV